MPPLCGNGRKTHLSDKRPDYPPVASRLLAPWPWTGFAGDPLARDHLKGGFGPKSQLLVHWPTAVDHLWANDQIMSGSS